MRRIISAMIMAAISMLLLPASAHASWPVATEQEVALGYEQAYEGEGRSLTHHGIDIVASKDAWVWAPVEGTVSFEGAVPASDDSTSETMLGVSIRLADGRTLTLMPFDDVTVEEGQTVSEGQMIGTLAADGDASSETAHLHVGLKRGRVYEDPQPLLGWSASEDEATDGGKTSSAVPIAEDVPTAATGTEGIASEDVATSGLSAVVSDTAAVEDVPVQGVPDFGTVSSTLDVAVPNSALPQAGPATSGQMADGPASSVQVPEERQTAWSETYVASKAFIEGLSDSGMVVPVSIMLILVVVSSVLLRRRHHLYTLLAAKVDGIGHGREDIRERGVSRKDRADGGNCGAVTDRGVVGQMGRC